MADQNQNSGTRGQREKAQEAGPGEAEFRACARNREERARDSKAPMRALEGGYQGTGWEREDKSLILRT